MTESKDEKSHLFACFEYGNLFPKEGFRFLKVLSHFVHVSFPLEYFNKILCLILYRSLKPSGHFACCKLCNNLQDYISLGIEPY